MKIHNSLFVNRRGFTLIEVLLAVMIIVSIAGSLYVTFAAGLKLERRVHQSFQDVGESRLIMEQLYRDLARVVDYDFSGSFPEQKSFEAGQTYFSFVIDDQGKLKWIRYAVIVPDAGQIQTTRLGISSARNVAISTVSSTDIRLLALIRQESDFIPSSALADYFEQRAVLTNRVVEGGWKVSFALTLKNQPKIEWTTSWEHDFVPAAVRVSLSVRSENGQVKEFVRDFVLPTGGRHES